MGLSEHRRKSIRAAQAKYRVTAKGKATAHKYNVSAKGKANQRRYQLSDKGRARDKRYNTSLGGQMMQDTLRFTPEYRLRHRLYMQEWRRTHPR